MFMMDTHQVEFQVSHAAEAVQSALDVAVFRACDQTWLADSDGGARRPCSGERSMDIVVDELEGGITNVALGGRLDRLDAETIESRFGEIASSKRALLVDLSKVKFIGSLGIRILLTTAKAIQSNGGKLAIIAPEGNVLTALKIAGMDAILPIFPERGTAIAAVGS
jgi:anti-sigma B factor antagonist